MCVFVVLPMCNMCVCVCVLYCLCVVICVCVCVVLPMCSSFALTNQRVWSTDRVIVIASSARIECFLVCGTICKYNILVALFCLYFLNGIQCTRIL